MAEKLVVFSDYVCPFCYIGKTIAQKLVEDYSLKMEWLGYEINPQIPPEGLTIEADYQQTLERVEKEEIVEVPTFIIDGDRFQGVYSYEAFQKYLKD